MPIKFYCNQCDQRLSIASKNAGKSISCPSCHNKITIPFESEPRRPDSTTNTPETPNQPENQPQSVEDFYQEENQLHENSDNLSSLGDSWEELLVEDWQDTASEESDPLKEETQVHEENLTPDNFESESPRQPVAPQPTDSQPEIEQASTEPETVPVENEPNRQNDQGVHPQSKFCFEDDEEEDNEDDDDGFRIRSAESEFDEMDLTPMVDVTFLLLIFFMITASFSLQKSIQVPPPNPDEDGVSQSLQTLDDFREESIIVEIDNNNGIYVDDIKLSNPSEIVQAILDRRNQDGKTKSELVLSAHKAARHETVVAVIDAANEVGMQKIRLASYRGPED
ncbi:MAG: biopolymer transporter ExbD [Gimesia sp.]